MKIDMNVDTKLSLKRSGLLLAAVMLLWPGAPLLAQSDASEEQLVLEEVIVTATRRETNVQTTSGAITALSGQQLEEMGKVNITDFISAVPGVTMAEGGWGKNRVIFPPWTLTG